MYACTEVYKQNQAYIKECTQPYRHINIFTHNYIIAYTHARTFTRKFVTRCLQPVLWLKYKLSLDISQLERNPLYTQILSVQQIFYNIQHNRYTTNKTCILQVSIYTCITYRIFQNRCECAYCTLLFRLVAAKSQIQKSIFKFEVMGYVKYSDEVFGKGVDIKKKKKDNCHVFFPSSNQVTLFPTKKKSYLYGKIMIRHNLSYLTYSYN